MGIRQGFVDSVQSKYGSFMVIQIEEELWIKLWGTELE